MDKRTHLTTAININCDMPNLAAELIAAGFKYGINQKYGIIAQQRAFYKVVDRDAGPLIAGFYQGKFYIGYDSDELCVAKAKRKGEAAASVTLAQYVYRTKRDAAYRVACKNPSPENCEALVVLLRQNHQGWYN